MGAFFTNVQVRGSDVAIVADALRADADTRGMDALANDDAGAADRVVLVLPPEQGWITIYDEATEGQDIQSLEALAAASSRATESFAFTVCIHDSDILDLRLFDRGARVDRLDSDPTYYGSVRPSKKERAAKAGNAAAWFALLDNDPARRDRLAEAFASQSLFAESMLRAVCDVVGCEPMRAATGYRYAIQDGTELPDGTITLRFRLRQRPAYETTSDAPTELVTESFANGEIRFAVGDEVRCSLGARSTGRASKGLGVRAWGSVLERGLVAIERFEVVIGNVRDGAKHQNLAPREARSGEGGKMFVADLVDAAIPPGSAEPFAGFAPGMDVMKAMDEMMRARVHVNVVGLAVATGSGELGIGLTPLERSEGSAGTIVSIAIDPTFELPLRMRDRKQVSGENLSHLLRPLAEDSQLVAMIGCDTRTALGAAALAAIESVRSELPDDAKVDIATFFADGSRRPKVGSGKVKTMLRGKKLASLIEAIERESMVTVDAGPFAMSAGTTVLPQSESERVPWMLLSLACEGRDVEAVRARWTALIDAAMRDGSAMQATLGRAGWRANQMVGQAAYESACGMAHDVGTLRRWIEQWVRVPSNDRLWVSRALADRADRSAVAAVADEEQIGTAVRFTLRDRSRWLAFEEAISAILPTAEDSRAARKIG